MIANYLVKWVLVDNKSLTNVIFKHALRKMQIMESQIIRKMTTVIGLVESKDKLSEK